MVSFLNVQSFFKSGLDVVTRGAAETIPAQAQKVYEFVKNNQSILLKFGAVGAAYLVLNYLSEMKPYFNGTANEMNLLKACGRSCFFDDKNSTKPLVLWLHSKDDHNRAFSLFRKDEIDRLRSVNEEVDLVFKEISDASSICYYLSRLSRKVDSLIIGAHGNPTHMYLSMWNLDNGKRSSTFDKSDLQYVLRGRCLNNLKEDATISLDSCSIGRGADSFAWNLAKISKRVVFAPEEVSYSGSYTISLFSKIPKLFKDKLFNLQVSLNATSYLTRMFDPSSSNSEGTRISEILPKKNLHPYSFEYYLNNLG